MTREEYESKEFDKPKIKTCLVREQIRLMTEAGKIEKSIAEKLVRDLALDDIEKRYKVTQSRLKFLDEFTELLNKYDATICFGNAGHPQNVQFQIVFPYGKDIFNNWRYPCYSISPQLLQTLKKRISHNDNYPIEE